VGEPYTYDGQNTSSHPRKQEIRKQDRKLVRAFLGKKYRNKICGLCGPGFQLQDHIDEWRGYVFNETQQIVVENNLLIYKGLQKMANKLGFAGAIEYKNGFKYIPALLESGEYITMIAWDGLGNLTEGHEKIIVAGGRANTLVIQIVLNMHGYNKFLYEKSKGLSQELGISSYQRPFPTKILTIKILKDLAEKNGYVLYYQCYKSPPPMYSFFLLKTHPGSDRRRAFDRVNKNLGNYKTA
jgi:hypothetical protein